MATFERVGSGLPGPKRLHYAHSLHIPTACRSDLEGNLGGNFLSNVHASQDDAIKHGEHPHKTRMHILSPGANNSTSRDKFSPQVLFQLPCNMMALAAHMPESVFDPWGTECVGEWQLSNWPAAQVFQCQNDSTWLIHFTYHQLVEHI